MTLPGNGKDTQVDGKRCASGISVALVVFLLLSAVVVVGWYYSRAPKHLFYPDAMEYASVARSMARGEGACSQALWVLGLSFNTDIPSPEVRRPLLLPFWTSLCFRVFGARDLIAIWASAFWQIVAVFLTFLLARRFFAKEVALWGTLLLLLDNATLRYAFGGLTEPLFATVLLLLVWALARAEKPLDFLIAGAILGLGQWVRVNCFIYFLPAAIFAIHKVREKTLLRLLCILIGFGVVALPISWRNLALTGSFSLNPLYSYVALNGTSQIPDHCMERSLTPLSPLTFFAAHPAELLSKWFRQFVMNVQCLGSSIYPFCFGIVLVGWLFAEDIRKRRIIGFTLISLMLSLALFSIGEYEDIRFYVPFAPLLFVLAADTLFSLGAKFRLAEVRVRAVLGLLTVLALLLTIQLVLDMDAGLNRERYLMTFGERVQETFPKDAVLLSDIPWVVGWRADRTAIWLPVNPEQVRAIESVVPVSGVVLTASCQNTRELSPKWTEISKGKQKLEGYVSLDWSDMFDTTCLVRLRN